MGAYNHGMIILINACNVMAKYSCRRIYIRPRVYLCAVSCPMFESFLELNRGIQFAPN